MRGAAAPAQVRTLIDYHRVVTLGTLALRNTGP